MDVRMGRRICRSRAVLPIGSLLRPIREAACGVDALFVSVAKTIPTHRQSSYTEKTNRVSVWGGYTNRGRVSTTTHNNLQLSLVKILGEIPYNVALHRVREVEKHQNHELQGFLRREFRSVGRMIRLDEGRMDAPPAAMAVSLWTSINSLESSHGNIDGQVFEIEAFHLALAFGGIGRHPFDR